MNRRRLLAVSVSLLAGCTGAGYRASGPRTPPRAPETAESRSTVEPSEARAQAVVKPLNELYRAVRGPLGGFEVADVSDDDVATAEASLAAARRALSTATAEGLAPGYGSLPTMVEAHAHLFDAFSATVSLYGSVNTVLDGRFDPNVDDAAAFESARERREGMADAAAALSSVAAAEPSVPAALFLTVERMRDLATAVDEESTRLAALLDALSSVRTADTRWREAMAALDDDAATARPRFEAAGDAYRAAGAALDSPPRGSFETPFDRLVCVSDAGERAVDLALAALSARRDGDDARASELLSEARRERTRCADD